MNGLALCAGIGGLELGIKLALGAAYRCLVMVEREAFAAAILVARMQDGSLDQAAIWDELGTFPSHLFRGRVDLLSAGFPCQPHSVAGRRGGVNDERWLWPQIERIIGDVGPGYVFLENVPGLLTSGGFGTVLGSLAALGYDAEWEVLSAAAVGAPHRRERLFILARAAGGRHGRMPAAVVPGVPTVAHAECSEWGPLHGRGNGRRQGENGDGQADGGPGESGEALGHAPAVGRGGARPAGAAMGRSGAARRLQPGRSSSGALADAARERDEGSRNVKAAGRGEPADDGLPLFPPGPGDAAWERLLAAQPDLAPATQSEIRGMAYGSAARIHRLRALGNAVVPVQAALALRLLMERLQAGERW